MSRRLLVTGFTAFPGAPVNPTERLVGELDTRTLADRLGIAVQTEILPVEYARAGERVARLWRDDPPVAMVHFGLAGRSRLVRVERRARNACAMASPDAAGRLPPGALIDPAGPAVRRSRLPAGELVTRLKAEGVAARASDDAGAYLCNFVSYLSLGLCGAAAAGFVHLPLPAELDGPRAPAGRPSWAGLERAVATVVATVAEAVRAPRSQKNA